jgi:hypothetical protein
MADARPIVLILVDGWAPRWLSREWSRLPNLAWLAAHGRMSWRVCSTFPSVTPTAIASLVTGRPPRAHGIRGILWYQHAEDRYVHYWPSPERFLSGTWDRPIQDVVIDLNARHLAHDTPTLFERLEARGHRVAVVNFPIHRATHWHRVRLPVWLKGCGRLERTLGLMGPRHWVWGDLLDGAPAAGLRRFHGLTDAFAVENAIRLFRLVAPDFLAVYLGDHDGHSHRRGPDRVDDSLRRIDGLVGRLLGMFGSPREALRRARWVLVGDHAQTRLLGGPASVDLTALVARRFEVASLVRGGLLSGRARLAVAPNDRMAYVHVREPEDRPAVRQHLLGLPAVGLVAWFEGGRFFCEEAGTGRSLSWKPGGDVRDAAGQVWSLSGDPGVLDCRQEGGCLLWGIYPDPLGRLAGALDRPGDLVVLAREGHEFHTGLGMGRGNHGGLCAGDSLVPLLAVGMPPLEGFIRLEHLAPWVLEALGGSAHPGSPGPS